MPQEIIVLYKQSTSISHPQNVIMIACKKLPIVLYLFYILVGAAFVINAHVCSNNVCIHIVLEKFVSRLFFWTNVELNADRPIEYLQIK